MCCLFGLLDYKHYFGTAEKSRVISILSQESEQRGTDATGIAYLSRNRLRIYKRPLPAHRMHFFIPDESCFVMGHTRMTTKGNERYNANNHPFEGRCGEIRFAIAHNGIIHNDRVIRQQYHIPTVKIQTDSYIAVQFLEKQKTLNFDSLKKMAETVEGSFTFTVLDSGSSIYFVKGSSPMCIYHFKHSGFYLYASTEEILQNTVKRLHLQKLPCERLIPEMGDIIRIDRLGNLSSSSFDVTNLLPEWPVFSGSVGRIPSKQLTQKNTYLQELKEIAGYYGYSSDDVDLLYARGYSCSEIEEILYGEDIIEDF